MKGVKAGEVETLQKIALKPPCGVDERLEAGGLGICGDRVELLHIDGDAIGVERH